MSKPEGTIKHCSLCKKPFHYKGSYIYKMDYRPYRLYFCSYTCYHRIKDLKEAREHEKIKEILGLSDSNNS